MTIYDNIKDGKYIITDIRDSAITAAWNWTINKREKEILEQFMNDLADWLGLKSFSIEKPKLFHKLFELAKKDAIDLFEIVENAQELKLILPVAFFDDPEMESNLRY